MTFVVALGFKRRIVKVVVEVSRLRRDRLFCSFHWRGIVRVLRGHGLGIAQAFWCVGRINGGRRFIQRCQCIEQGGRIGRARIQQIHNNTIAVLPGAGSDFGIKTKGQRVVIVTAPAGQGFHMARRRGTQWCEIHCRRAVKYKSRLIPVLRQRVGDAFRPEEFEPRIFTSLSIFDGHRQRLGRWRGRRGCRGGRCIQFPLFPRRDNARWRRRALGYKINGDNVVG